MNRLDSFGLAMPNILLPKSDIDLQKWSVIACDQHTQDRQYWDKVKYIVGNSPSTLNLIFPEVFLEDQDSKERIENIHAVMNNYLEGEIFAPPRRTCLYVERSLGEKRRRGLIICIDLEKYDWRRPETAFIRSTEDTVENRLPARMAVRRGASLELPHILLLIDDKQDTVLPALESRSKQAPPLYNTPLMVDSGSVAGWALDDENFIADVFAGFFEKQIQSDAQAPFLFAVGDGNHSLASAKEVWEEYKQAYPNEKAPLVRFAMVEIENLYDNGIAFEPIHRIIWKKDRMNRTSANVRPPLRALVEDMLSPLPLLGIHPLQSAEELKRLMQEDSPNNRLGFIGNDGDYLLLEFENRKLAVAEFQPLLDIFAEKMNYDIDYIHGDEEVCALAKANVDSIGVLLPPFLKDGLFETIAKTGSLPRKSFSMGRAEEKRFYLEARELFRSKGIVNKMWIT
ncbi:MAG: DUF1015 domain-containing protein [Treponema sp.]|jgi:uncharacterized protein (DUF1015 family)|nr:DUF1015 domain-containing protein [Treponema sp.]